MLNPGNMKSVKSSAPKNCRPYEIPKAIGLRRLSGRTVAAGIGPRNSSHSSKHAGWMPDLNQCWFADRVVRVPQEYGLTIDRAEADALAAVLSSCSSFEMVVVSASPKATPTRGPGT